MPEVIQQINSEVDALGGLKIAELFKWYVDNWHLHPRAPSHLRAPSRIHARPL